MLRFVNYNGERKLKVVSSTPTKKIFPHLNREQRRRLVHGSKSYRLMGDIIDLIKEMKSSGIKVPRMIKSKRRKYLSGYKSQLVTAIDR